MVGITSSGDNTRLWTFPEYVEILSFEYEREQAQSTKHFCSHSEEELKDTPKGSALAGGASQVTAGGG